MLENLDLKNVLILDIETVPQFSNFEELNEQWQKLWNKKVKHQLKDDVTASDLYNRAGINAEFGKIVCISVGIFARINERLTFRIKSFCGHDEKIILTDLTQLLNKSFYNEDHCVCAHNGREFDFPYIARRCLINNLPIPYILDNSAKKPWEVQCIDTMDMWKFGDFKSFTSLDLLAASFGINSPKDDMDGSHVWSAYWIDKDLDRIKTYCQKDVVTVAQLLLKFKGKDLLDEDDIVITN